MRLVFGLVLISAATATREARSADIRVAIVPVRGPGVEPTVTRGLPLKIGMKARKTSTCDVVPQRQLVTVLPSEDDPFLLECFSDDDCMNQLSETIGYSPVLMVIVERLAGGYRAKYALVDRQKNSIRRKAGETADAASLGQIVVHEATKVLRAEFGPVGVAAKPKPVAEPADREEAWVSVEPAPGAARVPAVEEPPSPPSEPASPPAASTARSDPECEDLYTPIPPEPPLAEGEKAPAFERPWALLLPVEIDPGIASAYQARLPKIVEEVFLAKYPMKRFRYVTPCDGAGRGEMTLTVDVLKERPPTRVEFVFAPKLTAWQEKQVEKKKGNLTYKGWEIEVEGSLAVYRVMPSGLVEYDAADTNVPGVFDFLTFAAEDAAAEAMSSAGGDAMALLAGGPPTPEQAYEEELDKIVGRFAQKLALETKKMERFRLASRMFGPEDDEVRFPLGAEEGVGMDDTYVMVLAGEPVDYYEGFGRVRAIGAGGRGGYDAPSTLEVISGYDEVSDPRMRLVEWPHLGFTFDFSGSFLPLSHGEMDLLTDETISGSSFGAGATLGVGYKLPFDFVSELYVHTDISFLFGLPAIPLVVDIGLEKRWYWGRFAPLLGVKSTVSMYGIATKGRSTGETEVAMGRAGGALGYLGFGLLLSPDFALKLTGGYRHYFSNIEEFEASGVTYVGTTIDGERFSVDMSGPYTVLALEYVL